MRVLEPGVYVDAVHRRAVPLRVAPSRALQSDYHGWRRHVKRALDLAVGTALLVISAPVMFIVAIVVKRSSPGPAIFKQERMGKGGRSFRMWKFRTMYVDSEERLNVDPDLLQSFIEHDFKIPTNEDPRVVPGARVLRNTSLDELPQLVNVIAGSMSLVGPRPVEPEQVSSYGDLDWAYLSARPGLTGKWQTSRHHQPGFPEPRRSRCRLPPRMEPAHGSRHPCRRTMPVILGSIRAVFRSNESSAEDPFEEPHRNGRVASTPPPPRSDGR